MDNGLAFPFSVRITRPQRNAGEAISSPTRRKKEKVSKTISANHKDMSHFEAPPMADFSDQRSFCSGLTTLAKADFSRKNSPAFGPRPGTFDVWLLGQNLCWQ